MIELALAAVQTEAAIQPWFSGPAAGIWIGAVGGGVFGGLLLGGIGGGVCGPLAGAGRARRFVMTYMTVLAVISVVLLGTGIYAVATGQPYHVWYGFTLLGGLGTFMCIGGLFLFRAVYARAEQRRLDAGTLRTS